MAPFVRTPASENVYIIKHLYSDPLKATSLFNIYKIRTFPLFSRQLGHKERESLLKLAEITKEGFLLKQQLIQEAMRGVDDRKVGCTGINYWLFVFRALYIRNTTLIRSCSTPFIRCPTGPDLTILIYFVRLNLKKFAQARVTWRRGWRL